MATLTAPQLQACRNSLAKEGIPINYTKAQANAAIQAVETWFDAPAQRSAISAAIDVATAPLVLTNAQKKKVVAYWANTKFDIERA